MATPPPKTAPRTGPYRFTVRQFMKMVDAGVFREGEHVELLGGVPTIVTKNEPHNYTVGALGDVLRSLIPGGYHFREEKPGRTRRLWRPEPDIAVVRGPRSDYKQRTPRLDRFALLFEVSDTSYAIDRGRKLRRYAASRVPVYGVIDLKGRRFERFTDPAGRGRSASYATITTYGPDDQVPVVLDGTQVGSFVLREVLP